MALPAGGGGHRAARSVRADARRFRAALGIPRSAARGLRRREPARARVPRRSAPREVGGPAGRARERRPDGHDGFVRRAGGDVLTGARPPAGRAHPGDGDALHGIDAGACVLAPGERPAAGRARRALHLGARACDGGDGRRAAHPEEALRGVVPQNLLPLPPRAGRLPRRPRVRRLKKADGSTGESGRTAPSRSGEPGPLP